MSYSDSFPATRPVFQADFANGGRIDPRISYSRSTTGTYFGTDKHLSSENLIPYSNNVSAAAWTKARLTVDSVNNSSPDGGTDASLILETADTGTHSFYDGFNCVSGQNYSFIFYAKPNGRTKLLFQPQATGAIASLEFDLVGAGTVTLTSGSTVSHSITQIGDWYKCQATITATATGVGYNQIYLDNGSGISYAGDVTKGIYAWGNQVSSTGETVLNATSGQIHREYAPTLQTAAINAPRFEFSATDSASEAIGSSRGLLIESASTNLFNYSDDLANAYWGKTEASATASAAVGPTGELNAGLLVGATTTNNHYLQRTIITTTASTTYTYSLYVKSAGVTKFTLLMFQNGSPYTQFGKASVDLATAAINGTVGSGARIESVGNGWYRVSVTGDAVSASSSVRIWLQGNSGNFTHTPNGYDGLLVAGQQFEANSFPSSLISTNGSQVTRASDSASMDLTQAGYTGGPVSVITETTGGFGSYPRTFSLSDGTINNYANIHRNGTDTDTSTDYRVRLFTDGASQVDRTASASASATKIGMSIDTNSVISTFDGGSSATDSSAVINTMTTLQFGDQPTGGKQWNGTLKRVSVYGTALSQTELESLTS